MGQEFIINSTALEDKINQLLPSQGGKQAGVDLSASTQIIPIVDLTESAEGSQLRQDLQTALDINVTSFNISNSTNSTIINTTGYYRLFGLMGGADFSAPNAALINIFDGTTSKVLLSNGVTQFQTAAGAAPNINFDFIVKVSAGHSIRGTANAFSRVLGVAKQIADINGNLT